MDLGALLNAENATPDTGYVLLAATKDESLVLWVEAIDGVKYIDLETLVSVDEVTSENSAACLRGTTEDRIVVINLESLFDRLRDDSNITN